MHLGSLGVTTSIPGVLRQAGHRVSVFRRVPSRAEARALDLLIVCGHPERLGVDVFAAPRLGTWNIHPSLLPARRGPQPLRWAILEGDECYGVSVHQMSHVIDDGALWWQDRIPRGDGGYRAVLHALLSRASDALADLVARADRGVRPESPRWGGGSHQGRVPPALLRLDPHLDATTFCRRVAATDDRRPALDGPRGVEVLSAASRAVGGVRARPGEVVTVTSSSLTFAVRDGLVVVTTARPPRARAGDVLRAKGLS